MEQARQGEGQRPAALLRAEADAVWASAHAHLRRLGCAYRLFAHPRSPYIWARQSQGKQVITSFSLAPLRRGWASDIQAAVALCERAHALGHWPRGQRGAAEPISWAELAEQVEAQVIASIAKEGSRVHLLNDLRKRIASLPGEPSVAALESWALEVDPLKSPRTYNRRLEVISQIERSRLLPLGDLLEELRRRRPRGAAVRLGRSRRERVRVVPSDGQIEAWLDQLDGFNQWVYGVLAVYGLRPHELWHVQPPDGRGWVTVPGGMVTKSARAHFAPPVLERWLQRYQLAAQWPERREQLLARWPVRWEQHSGVAVAVNNAALGQYLYKQFTLRGVPQLLAPLADGDGESWVRPYDLRHAYAIRCATSSETAGVAPEQQAEWLGHSEEVHQGIYLRWLPDSRKRQALQRQLDAGRAALEPSERQELEQLRQQMAALQQLLRRGDISA